MCCVWISLCMDAIIYLYFRPRDLAFPAPGGYGIYFDLTKDDQCYFHVIVYLFHLISILPNATSQPAFHPRSSHLVHVPLSRMVSIRKNEIAPHRTNHVVIFISRQPPYPRKRKRHRVAPTIVFPITHILAYASLFSRGIPQLTNKACKMSRCPALQTRSYY
jgi:hypothetical protein